MQCLVVGGIFLNFLRNIAETFVEANGNFLWLAKITLFTLIVDSG